MVFRGHQPFASLVKSEEPNQQSMARPPKTEVELRIVGALAFTILTLTNLRYLTLAEEVLRGAESLFTMTLPLQITNFSLQIFREQATGQQAEDLMDKVFDEEQRKQPVIRLMRLAMITSVPVESSDFDKEKLLAALKELHTLVDSTDEGISSRAKVLINAAPKMSA